MVFACYLTPVLRNSTTVSYYVYLPLFGASLQYGKLMFEAYACSSP